MDRAIELHVVHGQPTEGERARSDVGYLSWATSVRGWSRRLRSTDLIWLPFPVHLRCADLVIIMQENRQLSNYPLLLSRYLLKRKVAYWGHGANFQSAAPKGVRELWKRLLISKVDWWFAYTAKTVDILRREDYPADRITCLNNAIDNEAFERDLANVSSAELARIRIAIDAPAGAAVAIFCGSLYPDKKLDFLIAAGDEIHSAIPEFRMVVIGNGPSANEVQLAAKSRSWLKFVGVRKGGEKAAYFRIADVVLNPGAVGLHVLDSFFSGVPMVTTAAARHGPEIAYLRNGENGLIVDGDCTAYAEAVIGLLRNGETMSALKHASLSEAGQFTLNSMVTRFADGIEQCVSAPRMNELRLT
jgi:L-malate glycosyltransferase